MKKLCIFMTATPSRLFALGTCLKSFAYHHNEINYDVVIHIEDMPDSKTITPTSENDIKALNRVSNNIIFLYTSKHKNIIYEGIQTNLFNNKLWAPINILTLPYIFNLAHNYEFVAKIDDDMFFNSSVDKCLDSSYPIIARRAVSRINKSIDQAIQKINSFHKTCKPNPGCIYNGGFIILSRMILQYPQFKKYLIENINLCGRCNHFIDPTVEELCLSLTAKELKVPIKHDVRLHVYPKYANQHTVAIHPSRIGKFWDPIKGITTIFLCPEWFFYYSKWVKYGGSEVEFTFDKNINRLERWFLLKLPKYWIKILSHHSLFINLQDLEIGKEIALRKDYSVCGISPQIFKVSITLGCKLDSVTSIQISLYFNKTMLSENQILDIKKLLSRSKYECENENKISFSLSSDLGHLDATLDDLEQFILKNKHELESILSNSKYNSFLYLKKIMHFFK